MSFIEPIFFFFLYYWKKMRRDVQQFTQLFSVPSSSHVFQFLTFTAYGGFQHAKKRNSLCFTENDRPKCSSYLSGQIFIQRSITAQLELLPIKGKLYVCNESLFSFSSGHDLHDEDKYLIRNTAGFYGRCCLNRPHLCLRVPLLGYSS